MRYKEINIKFSSNALEGHDDNREADFETPNSSINSPGTGNSMLESCGNVPNVDDHKFNSNQT